MRRDAFQAIADPTRRAILGLLSTMAMTPNSLAEHFDISRQAVSKHIKILSECRMLNHEQNGREIYYSFNPRKLKEVSDWLNQFEIHMELKFKQLDKVIRKNKIRKRT